MDSLFGLEFSLPMKFFIAFAIVLILIGTAAYLLRRFGTGALATTTQRNRQPRLAVVDSAPLDGRRKLVIVRRDNVEHLVMIGGPTDVVVESNIVRAGVQATRETAIRTTSVEPLALPEETNWPPVAAAARVEQPVARPEPTRPEPVARPEPVMRAESPVLVRPAAVPIPTTHAPAPPAQHAPVPPPPPPGPIMPQAANDAPPAPTAVEVRHAAQPAPPPRPAVVAPAPIGASAERPAAQAPVQRPQPERTEPAAAVNAPARTEPTARPPAPEPAANEEQNLADMANRLEAALRRPAPVAPAPSAPPAPTTSTPPDPPAPRPRPTPVAAPPRPPQQSSPNYENLQREMANLLGRQSGSS